ncbi:lysosomal alpha-mannosidase [Rhipicephalus microplus]|uniref:lysosomal alpha-mannosidase n=1 Tax=Rhipicephalus microplus TaxID=6941 RepID=UPI003F6BE403
MADHDENEDSSVPSPSVPRQTAQRPTASHPALTNRTVDLKTPRDSGTFSGNDDEDVEKMASAIRTGRLQFVGGGWTQNDEAVTHYTATIDQMTLGLRFLNSTFGPQCGVPSVAWQADPFGHTVTQAALFARMGFSSVMLGRISFDTKSNWQHNRSMEFVWETDSREQGGDGVHILAWVPENTYTTPEGICFGWSDCLHPRGSVQAERATAATLIQYARRQADVYTNDTVAMMSGCDLCFADGDERFPRQDAILAKANRMSATQRTRPRVHVVHSTPACYVEALHSVHRSWPRFAGDLMPYTDRPGRTWTGFYSTRPNLKMMVRYANGFLQASKQLSLHGAEGATARVTQLGEAVATLQHHDGITGTSTDDVAHDYALMLYKGIKECELVIASGLVSMMNPGVPSSMDVAKQMGFCHLLNQSTCPFTENEREFSVLVYNPASVPVSYHVRLPINGSDERTISVVGPAGAKVESQVVPSAPHRFEAPEALGNNTSSLVFQVTVEPLGASLYHVKREPPASQVVPDFLKLDEPASFIENERFRVVVDPETGLVSRIVLLRRETTVHLRQTFGAYMFEVKAPGNMSPPGHYTFSAYREAEDLGDHVTYRIVKGPVVQEIHQIFNGFISQVIALHKDSPYIEFTWTVGPLTNLLKPSVVQSSTGCDVVSRFDADLNSEGFYTDGNGWRNMRRTVTLHKDKLPIPANYYPVTSWIYIEDEAKDLQMLLIPDRSQGGTSLRKGHLELMVHRRHATTDELGNPEFLLESGGDNQALVARGTHRLFVGPRAEVASIMRLQALQLVYRPLLVFAPAGWRPRQEKFSALRQPLPSTVHVLTLEMLPTHEILLRLEHLATNDTTAKIGITSLLLGRRLERVRPVTLGANSFLPGPKRHRWHTQEAERKIGKPWHSIDDVTMPVPEMNTESSTGDTYVNLRPGEIATFLAKLVAE